MEWTELKVQVLRTVLSCLTTWELESLLGEQDLDIEGLTKAFEPGFADRYHLDRLGREWSASAARIKTGKIAWFRSVDQLHTLLLKRQALRHALESSVVTPSQLNLTPILCIPWCAMLIHILELLSIPSSEDLGDLDSRFSEARLNQLYYDRFGLALWPFLKFIAVESNRLHEERVTEVRSEYFSQSRVDGLVRSLLLSIVNRMELATAAAVEVELRIYCTNKKTAHTSPSENYRQFMKETFLSSEKYMQFADCYPLWLRWIAVVSWQTLNGFRTLADRVVDSRKWLSKGFGIDLSQYSLCNVETGLGDYHDSGASVACITLGKLGSRGQFRRIIYKPRSIKTDIAWHSFIQRISRQLGIRYEHLEVIDRDAYCFVEYAQSGDLENDDKVYRNYIFLMGIYLAASLALGSSDLHMENIVLVRGVPIVIDCETVLDCIPSAAFYASNTIFDSVLKSGLLDWPFSRVDSISVSGIQGDGRYKYPGFSPRIVKRGTDQMSVERKRNRTVVSRVSNKFAGRDSFQPGMSLLLHSGFDAAYTLVSEKSSEFAALIRELWKKSEIRYVVRNTQTYATIIDSFRHASVLMDVFYAEANANSLYEGMAVDRATLNVVTHECHDLLDFEIPRFTVKASGRSLWWKGKVIATRFLRMSPIDEAVCRLSRMSEASRMRQHLYIQTSLGESGADIEGVKELAKSLAVVIGQQVMQDMERSGALGGIHEGGVDRSNGARPNLTLYDGLAGVLLFLTSLGLLVDERYLNPVLRLLPKLSGENDLERTGAFTGLGGLIYAKSTISRLLGLPSRPSDFAIHLRQARALIARDSEDDVLSGNAGCILSLLRLHELGVEGSLDLALLAGNSLMAKRRLTRRGTHWPHDPQYASACLAGFSHGLSGIGLALIELGSVTGEGEFVRAGLSAFKYESTRFDEKRGGWLDLRVSSIDEDVRGPAVSNTWCNGAPGIGLARLRSINFVDASLLADDVERALDATLAGLGEMENWCLCHGLCGHLEFLLDAAVVLDRPYLTTEVHAWICHMVSSYETTGRLRCHTETTSDKPLISLMTGSSGIGYHLLRVAFDRKLPNVLVLAR